MATIPADITTHLAWRFETVVPGAFRRDKKDYATIDFPILGPLPHRNAATGPLEGAETVGPFVYFLVDGRDEVRYVGKSKEKTVVKRWVRPGIGGPATHYWTHTNKTAGCVRRIAEGINAGRGPFHLRFLASSDVPTKYLDTFNLSYAHLVPLERVERGLISLLRPEWNEL